MVKNLTGGSSHKKFGRKFTNNSVAKAGYKLRVSEDEGELYCIVTKNLGNNMFHCYSLDGQTYLGHIRGKFTGRGKRDNTIAPGTWVLVGIRAWDNAGEKIKNGKVKYQQSDLLEVYSDSDKQRLIDTVDEKWETLINKDPTKINKDDINLANEFSFKTDKDVERENLIKEVTSETAAKLSLSTEEKEKEEDWVDFDAL